MLWHLSLIFLLSSLAIYSLTSSKRYPKAGTIYNPTIMLKVADLADPKSIRFRDLTPPPILHHRYECLTLFSLKSWIDISLETTKNWRFIPINQKIILWKSLLIFSSSIPYRFYREHYFASAAWVSQTEVSVVWMNRAQNLSVVTLCKSPMWYCQEVRNSKFKNC